MTLHMEVGEVARGGHMTLHMEVGAVAREVT